MSASMQLAHDVVDLLVDAGIHNVVLSPGSRSGPLALALYDADQSGAICLHVRVDERTAGFLALGMAKASHRPVPIVTTSGTAVANLHPAVLEAKHARVPILVVSADRPASLRGTGANQTTDQRRIFGDIPYAELASGSSTAEVLDAWLTDPTGPAQLNLEFDQPLLSPLRWGNRLGTKRGGKTAPMVPPAEVLGADKKTVVVAGDNAGPPARRFAEEGNWPLFAEPSSGSRTGTHPIGAYRMVLQHSRLATEIERVIVFGHPTLSRPIIDLLGRTDLETIMVGGDLSDFPNRGDHVRLVPAVTATGPAEDAWVDAWRAHGQSAVEAISSHLGSSHLGNRLDGTIVARDVMAALPPGGLLYVGSSNPIRDLDLLAAPHLVGERRLTLANRGLSGIDGTVSSAIGAALARPSPRALAYLGDLTFLHDANGLLIGPDEPRPDLTIVVASDDGGSIFATLEQGGADYEHAFERVYATPTGANIGLLCSAYGIAHTIVRTVADLRAELASDSSGIRVLEVPIDRSRRLDLASELTAAVRAAVAEPPYGLNSGDRAR